MSIKKADSAGFCFGVNRAINIVNELLEKGIKVATLGPIIHNMEMVHELEERGCTPVKAVDELTDDTTLVIRSHGVEKSVIDSLVKRGINFEDATCPFVKKIHKIVSNTNPENDVVLIAGNKNHPEVCKGFDLSSPKAHNESIFSFGQAFRPVKESDTVAVRPESTVSSG